ncbi:hypothetical protein GE061_012211, partial [Apolygus lucorum]
WVLQKLFPRKNQRKQKPSGERAKRQSARVPQFRPGDDRLLVSSSHLYSTFRDLRFFRIFEEQETEKEQLSGKSTVYQIGPDSSKKDNSSQTDLKMSTPESRAGLREADPLVDRRAEQPGGRTLETTGER